MIHVINSVDSSKLENSWQSFDGTIVSLQEMIEGYLTHIELHFNEIQDLIEK